LSIVALGCDSSWLVRGVSALAVGAGMRYPARRGGGVCRTRHDTVPGAGPAAGGP
jgi:hypothetical protein